MRLGQALREPQRELTVFRNRLMLAGLGILVGFGILLARFTWLQVVRGEHYHTLAEAFSGWRESAPHNRVMLDAKATRIGIATAYAPKSKYKVYWALAVAADRR